MKNLLMFTVIVAILVASQVSAGVITTVSINGGSGVGYSTAYSGREPICIINGAGLNWLGVTDAHDQTTVTGTMWLCDSGTIPQNQWIVFNLGDDYILSDIKVWNYNNNANYGVGQMEVLVSTDNSTWTSLGTVSVPAAPISYTIPFGSLLGKSTSTAIRYVKFSVISNGAGATNTVAWVGLSEVRFYGTVSGNAAPVVDAGSPRGVKVGGAVALDSTVTDDGLPNPPAAVTLTWSKVSGPGNVTFTPNTSVADPNVSFDTAGDYVLQLTANDGGKTASDTVSVKALPSDYRQLATDTWIADQSVIWWGDAYQLINNLSMTWSPDGLYGIHAGDGTSYQNMWLAGDTPIGEWVTFDLGRLYHLNWLRIWNQRQVGYETLRGVGDIKIYLDNDIAGFDNGFATATLVAHPSGDVDGSQLIAIDDSAFPAGVRYVKIEVASQLWPDGVYAGLAELRLSGTIAPVDCNDALNSGYDILISDVNHDCKVNFGDFALIAQNWLRCMVPTDAACEKPWE